MWETFISLYINNYLGKYVENLNSQQLSFALRQGELELENVPLKKNIFRSWGLPVEVRSGVVGRIKIEFNLLKYFRNEPVLISIEDVYLVAGPLNLSEWDPVEEAALAHEVKMSSLDSHEGRWKAQFDLASNSSSYYSSLYFSSMQIGASIVTKVVENLQLNVHNVHIRFEEETKSPKRTIAFGLTLKSLTAQSCDSSWNPLSTSCTGSTTDCSFKTLQLTEFGIYCDTRAVKFSDLTPLELINAMKKISKGHEYLLCPVSAEARICKNNSSNPLSSSSQPRFDVQLSLEKVPLQISDSQYRNTFRSYKAFSRLLRNCRLRHYRPFLESVKQVPVLWWKYAVRAILAYRGYKRRTVLKKVEDMIQRARDNVTFVTAYEQHLKQELVSIDLRKLKDRMEAELHYDEIVALREVAMRRVEKQNHASTAQATREGIQDLPESSVNKNTSSGATGTGVFSYIFPSWSNWLYSADTSATATEPLASTTTEDFENEIIQLRKSESELDESILDDVKSFGRDSLLARFKFVLKKGVVALNRRNGKFLEFNFCDVDISTELRPKSGSHKFHMTLAALSLRDCSTKSLIISPHTNLPSLSNSKSQQKHSEQSSVEPIFKLLYEKRPHKKAGHRISLTTKPLDIVIYPVLWKQISAFFKCSEVEDYLEIPQNRYELMKEKTKEEIKIYWERLINSETNSINGGHLSNWEINLDISAPQIVIHGSSECWKNDAFKDQKRFNYSEERDIKEMKFLVFDLGRFRFTNMVDSEEIVESTNFPHKTNEEIEDEEEEFMTPCSSPAPEKQTSEGHSESTSSRPSDSDLTKGLQNEGEVGLDFSDSLEELQAKLYKKYKLEITDIQIIVAEGKSYKDGSWKIANSRCTSVLHLVDRFSIILQLERRVLYSEDPEWPALTVMATLPKLNLHLNKSKVVSLQNVLRSYFVKEDPGLSKSEQLNRSVLSGSQINLHETSFETGFATFRPLEKQRSHIPPANIKESINQKLFLAQFTIQSVSVEIQSQGRSIAELQIAGARTTLTKWTKNTSISFVIHSLLLADAVQTFGPDFELLLASHKHVSMDSVSGSLLDSDPTSPMSPQSPSSPLPFSQPKTQGVETSLLSIPSELHDALLSSLLAKGTKHSANHGIQSPTYDSEALITAELMFVSSDTEDVAVLSVLFNNLDFIANQETLVEILQFLQEINPNDETTGKTRTESGSSPPLLPTTDKWKLEASFDFNRLNILLLRGVLGKDGNRSGRKIATATACDARVGFSIGGNELKIEGSLGGLQMLNLTPEGKYHQRVLSVGKDPLMDDTYNVFTSTSIPRQSAAGGSSVSALEFTFEKSSSEHIQTLPLFAMRMASVIYTYDPIFLIDLKKCINQFQVPLAIKLKSAAAQIALGLVRQETGPGLNSGGGRSPCGSFSASLDKLNGEDGGDAIVGKETNTLGVRLDIIFDSPVIALPRSRTSSEVLVANLGQITISANGASIWDDGLKSTPTPHGERGEGHVTFDDSYGFQPSRAINYRLLIRDVSLYSLDLKERWSMISNMKTTYPTSNRNTLMRAQELYYCDSSMAKPILHNTVLQFSIDHTPEVPFFNSEMNTMMSLEGEAEFLGPEVRIQGRVVNPLKVSLTPEQYAQVLDSLNNVAAGEEDFLQSEIKVELLEVRKVLWEKELSEVMTSVGVPRPSPTKVNDESISVSATFEVPELIMEMVLPEVEMGNREIPHLSLSCSELSFECEKSGFVTDMKVCLKSLTLEDTNAPKESPYRLLAISQASDVQNASNSSTATLISSVFHRNPNISTSCPDLIPTSPIIVPETFSPLASYYSPTSCARTESSSLPDHLDPDDIFSGRFHSVSTGQKSSKSGARSRSKKQKTDYRSPMSPTGSNGPVTPPPSPRPMDTLDNLVTIQVTIVDSKSPYFFQKYKGMHKSTDVEFNTLDVLLTPSTFACLRRFFSEAFRSSDFEEGNRTSNSQQQHDKEGKTKIRIQSPSLDASKLDDSGRNTEMEIHVKALRVKLAQLIGTTAEAEVTNVMCRFVNQGKDFNGVDGRMGSLQVKDLSPYAGKYPVKFIFHGKQALNFDYYRTDNEAKFRLEMASVLYIHTHRFYTELSTLFYSLFGNSDPPPAEVEPNSAPVTTDNSRVILNIQAGAPVIFLPYSSTSTSLLVADLGHVSVRNKFTEENDGNRVFDYISVDLMEMDLYSAELQDESQNHIREVEDELKCWIFDEVRRICKTSSSSSLLKNKCALNLKVKRLLNRTAQMNPTEASLSIHGTLSTVYATLNLEKYILIRGLLQYNIGEQIEVSRPSSPFRHRRQSKDVSSARGRLTGASVPASAKLELAIELVLVNVTVEILKEHERKLSRVDFLRSKFTFQNFSDGTQEVDLESQEILMSDIRCKASAEELSQTNVFTNILQPSPHLDTKSKRSDGKSIQKLQAEVHLRETQRGSNVTILIDNMRLMLLLDWWMEVQSFLAEEIPKPPPLSVEEFLEASEWESIAEKHFFNVSPLLSRSRELINPVTVSTGIVTKRAPVLDVPVKTFDFKLNVGDCELVVVEDPSVWDTNAVILKVTAALTYRPHLERPISCNIMESELFSCVLGIESETALTILDPTNVTFEVLRRTKVEPQGILDATLSPSYVDKILKIKSSPVSLRLSYYDMRIFVQLLERFSKEAKTQLMKRSTHQRSVLTSLELKNVLDAEEGGGFLPKGVYQRNYYFEEESVDQLLAMGFPRAESREALAQCEGRVEEAAILLSSSAPNENLALNSLKQRRLDSNDLDGRKNSLTLEGVGSCGRLGLGVICEIEFKIKTLSLCVIDDCRDADVPLVELNVSGLVLVQNCVDRVTLAEATLSGDYYNRELCGWEPFLEPWKCSLSLKQNECGQLGKYSPSSEFPTKAPEIEISLTARQVMNINLTSTLLSLYKTVSSNWSDDYGHQDKRRTPFVPFVLRNETGSMLWFFTIISNHEEILRQQQKEGKSLTDGTSWIQVANGATQAFSFEGRGKLRHRNTHQLKMHQLVVRVNGWFESSPVSVDRVGIYFRAVTPISNISKRFGAEVAELPTARLVFEVSLQGSAQKLVRIRSALMVKNTLPQTMELKLENTIIYPAFEMAQTGGSYCIHIRPQHTYPIPLHSVCAQIWIRPMMSSEFHQVVYSYCSKPLLLGRDFEGLRTCTSLASNQIQPYRFCVAVKKDEFPADTDEPKGCSKPLTYNVTIGLAKRANLITILSPLTIVNLLPYEVMFEIKEHAGGSHVGRIFAGKKSYITNVETTESMEISFSTENFPQGSSVTVSTNSTPSVARLRLFDTQKRPLYLNARVSRGDGGTITIRIACQHWIINKSGLPLIIKQEGVTVESAGQFHEHEHARMMVPLLFSFSDAEGASSATLRVGTGLHPLPAKTHWCRSFPLQNGTRVGKLAVTLSHSQPEVVYSVGVEVNDGKGRYRDSKFVTISPRFIIENRSSHRMQISQRNFATSFLDPAAEATHLTLPPGCTLPFHWPRLDKDQLLCVRLVDVIGGSWSGGFRIENVFSFHLNVRDLEGSCYFLRVETVIEGPTYFVVFSDTEHLPPPFRVDNLAFVPIIFHQANVGDERLKLVAKPESSFPYAWDEPTQPPHMALTAPGGTSTIANMSTLTPGLVAHITYENFFYIALTATFPLDEAEGLGISGMETLQLVLDVPEGSKVVLRKKEAGNRNQLWRVNADGLIEHEGSSPPRDPRKSVPTSSLVLDIAGQATTTQCVHLMLRKPDNRRVFTQHWEFTKDGRLKCASLSNMFVQAKDGFDIVSRPGTKNSTSGQLTPVTGSWQIWNEVVLGPPQPICYVRTNSGIPVEQAIARQKLRPGSGRLSVYVDTDGPTRVLRIIDTEKPPRSLLLNHTFEENSINTIPRMTLSLDLHEGVGLSIISCKPREELIYVHLSKLSVHWLDTKESDTINASVDYLQIDNQLLEPQKSTVVYVTRGGRSNEEESSSPALCLRWKKLKSKLNAHLFKECQLVIKPLSIIFDEKLLLKLCSWIGLGEGTMEYSDESDEGLDIQKALTTSTSLTTKRFYFGQLRIILNNVRLSVLTSSLLTPDLALIKRRLGLTLIRFEDTLVDLDPFYKEHPFETFDFLLVSLLNHYKAELLSQALVVLGSVDFLGNPVGFVNDVSVGVSSLIHEGSFDALVWNVTHGLSNSAAKVTGSLGDGLTRTLTLDSKHEESRQSIRDKGNSTLNPLSVGFAGFRHGMWGGFSSIAKQTYMGVVNDGFTGLVSGLGKGIVGTVTKPAVGVLDFATGVAAAVRDSSRTSARMLPNRIRLTRVVSGNGGLLPPYSEASAKGQELLYEMNGRDQSGLFIGCETVGSGIRILVSSERVTIFTQPKLQGKILEIPLGELLDCQLAEVIEQSAQSPSTSMYSVEKKLVIEFTRISTNYNVGITTPQVIVENEQAAKTVVQQVNYARVLYEEMRHSQINKPTSATDE